MEFVMDTTEARHGGGLGMLVLRLQRTYHKGGTNGILTRDGQHICHTIELPWRDNRRNVSCIPEGRYRLALYPSVRQDMRICVEGVPGRSGIRIHAANHAATELRGCIAPVTTHTGTGKGSYSRVALERLERLLWPVMEAGQEVFIEVEKLTIEENGTETINLPTDQGNAGCSQPIHHRLAGEAAA